MDSAQSDPRGIVEGWSLDQKKRTAWIGIKANSQFILALVKLASRNEAFLAGLVTDFCGIPHLSICTLDGQLKSSPHKTDNTRALLFEAGVVIWTPNRSTFSSGFKASPGTVPHNAVWKLQT